MDIREIRHFHLFCGLGGGAAGFNRGEARVGSMVAKFRCIGGIDVDRAAVADFQRLAGAPGTLLDLFDREQYIAFHGKEPPAGWREATPQDLQRAEKASALYHELHPDNPPEDGRCHSVARTKLEECVMWATKGVTGVADE